MSKTILIVDDDPVQRRLVEAALIKFGYDVLQADDGEAALTLLESGDGGRIGAMILDLLMPKMSGMDVLQAMREKGLSVPVIVQTAQGSIDTVIGAMRAGAFDFVVKPAAPDRLNVALGNALKVNELQDAVGRARKPAANAARFDAIVTRSRAMARVLNLSRKASSSTIPIMIEGESGTGKELIARAIRAASDRSGKPFVTVNCGAIPENLVESILFGHEKGSFTGATERHVGKFVEANGGTLFLDEIGDLPLNAQVKLLRAVQEGEVDPVGGKKSQTVDIRIISATHRDLVQAVRDGRFREDLYYRLNVFPIRLPPLRERRDDIGELATHFVRRFAKTEAGCTVKGISEEAVALLRAYDWPGNIRQLENAVFRATVLCDGVELTPAEFPQIKAQVEGIDGFVPAAAEVPPLLQDPAMVAPPLAPVDAFQAGDNLAAMIGGASPDAGIPEVLDAKGDIRRLCDLEGDMIRFAIDRYDGQMSEIARRLGIGRSTLYRKLKDLGIDPESERPDKLAS